MNEKKTKLEQYADIQPMVQKEIQSQFEKLYKQYATKYGVASVPRHTHNGFDAPKVNAWDLNQSQASTGSITMSTDGTRYRIGLNLKPGLSFAPSIVRFNGIVVNPSTAAPTIRALVCGDAFIGSSFYQQPESSTSVNIGGIPQVVIQSSSYILVNNSGAGPATQALTSEGHIISVTFNGNIVARATIPDLGLNSGASDSGPVSAGDLLVDVELAANWHIIGNWQVS